MELDLCSGWDSHRNFNPKQGVARQREEEEDGRNSRCRDGELDLWTFRDKKRHKVRHTAADDTDKSIGRSHRGTELCDIPSSIVAAIIALVSDTRSRNASSLVCREWHSLERCTRLQLCLRGSSAELHMLPTSFHAVRRLDVSHVSPWGTSLFAAHSAVCGPLTARWLHHAFPAVVDLTVYVRDGTDIQLVAATWPGLETVGLVRWHQRPAGGGGGDAGGGDAGMELRGLLASCPRLAHLDLSRFYCWTEDIAPALQFQGPSSTLRVLNLLKLSPEGFKAGDLVAIATACAATLEELYVLCEFDPRFLDCVSDESLVQVAENCPRIRVLHLVDSTQFSSTRELDGAGGGDDMLDASVTPRGLASLFQALPLLEDVALLLGHRVRDSAPAFEALAKNCPGVRSLHVGHFEGLCSCDEAKPDGLARGGSGIKSLQLRSCHDLSDAALATIAVGCPRISRLGLRCCPLVTPPGIRRCAAMLSRSLTWIEIECCLALPTCELVRALAPVRSSLHRLHVDCVWQQSQQADGEEHEVDNDNDRAMEFLGGNVWKNLRHLSLWISAAHLISPLVQSGLIAHCPLLGELSIRVEGDCRRFAKPQAREFGLGSFSHFPSLAAMRLDLSEAVGYALSAPGGNRDLSIWERFYLQGIQTLATLRTLDYFPPSDKDVNYRGMTLPGVGLISQCQGLRKLFVHGTAYEHLFMMLLKIPNLRDVQLRADYFPAPDMETSTEMRVESCKRFENLLEKRGFPD